MRAMKKKGGHRFDVRPWGFLHQVFAAADGDTSGSAAKAQAPAPVGCGELATAG